MVNFVRRRFSRHTVDRLSYFKDMFFPAKRGKGLAQSLRKFCFTAARANDLRDGKRNGVQDFSYVHQSLRKVARQYGVRMRLKKNVESFRLKRFERMHFLGCDSPFVCLHAADDNRHSVRPEPNPLIAEEATFPPAGWRKRAFMVIRAQA